MNERLPYAEPKLTTSSRIVMVGGVFHVVVLPNDLRARADLPKKVSLATCGLAQIDETGLCPILAEIAPMGS